VENLRGFGTLLRQRGWAVARRRWAKTDTGGAAMLARGSRPLGRIAGSRESASVRLTEFDAVRDGFDSQVLTTERLRPIPRCTPPKIYLCRTAVGTRRCGAFLKRLGRQSDKSTAGAGWGRTKETMVNFRFIHAADLNLDSPLIGLAKKSEDYAARLDDASRRAFDNLVALAIEEDCRLIVIAGDIFDGQWRDYRTGLFFIDRMRRLRQAGIRVVIIAGNHDAENRFANRLEYSGRRRGGGRHAGGMARPRAENPERAAGSRRLAEGNDGRAGQETATPRGGFGEDRGQVRARRS
jgi:Calcineurin-like phosphoesterase